MTHSACDVSVIGGGPAGLAAALALQRSGLQAMVLDRAVPPIDKACGEGLMPDGMRALAELGVKLPAETGRPFRGICFLERNGSVSADFPSGPGIAVRRTTLHGVLVDAARRAGAVLHWGVKRVSVYNGEVIFDGHICRPRWIVAADGQNSSLRRDAGLDSHSPVRKRYGFRRHFRLEPWSHYVEVYWGPGCQVYVTPVSGDEVGFAVISDSATLRLAEALNDFPDLERRLRGAQPVSRETGGLSVTRKLENVCCGRLALIGDASGSVDAITGEGISISFRQALSLAEALKRGRPEDYAIEHARISDRCHSMARLLLALGEHAAVRRATFSTFRKRPAIFESLLAVHVGDRSCSELSLGRLLEFGSALLP